MAYKAHRTFGTKHPLRFNKRRYIHRHYSTNSQCVCVCVCVCVSARPAGGPASATGPAQSRATTAHPRTPAGASHVTAGPPAREKSLENHRTEKKYRDTDEKPFVRRRCGWRARQYTVPEKARARERPPPTTLRTTRSHAAARTPCCLRRSLTTRQAPPPALTQFVLPSRAAAGAAAADPPAGCRAHRHTQARGKILCARTHTPVRPSAAGTRSGHRRPYH